MKGNILVLKGTSQYNVLRVAADYMIEAFRKRKYGVTVIDLEVKEDIDDFSSVIQNKFELIFSYQALLFAECDPDNNTSLFSLLIDTPVFGHIVDHPIYHRDRIKPFHGDNIYVGCMDKNHIQYIQKFYPNMKNVVFLPHAGCVAKNIIPYKDRTIDVFFPSSYINPKEVIETINKLPVVYKTMVELIIKNMFKNPMLTFQDALIQYLDQINFIYSSDDFIQMMIIMEVVDQYIRAFERDNLIQKLLEKNIKVTVSGSGWECFDSPNIENIEIISNQGTQFLDVLEMMGNSKVVLNNVPTLQNGTHERIFSSMLCGAISATNDFPIIRNEFMDGENIMLYTGSELEIFAGRIKGILESPDHAADIASQGSRIANLSHTCDKNAEEILKIVGKSQA